MDESATRTAIVISYLYKEISRNEQLKSHGSFRRRRRSISPFAKNGNWNNWNNCNFQLGPRTFLNQTLC
jgi:hypothetical protein